MVLGSNPSLLHVEQVHYPLRLFWHAWNTERYCKAEPNSFTDVRCAFVPPKAIFHGAGIGIRSDFTKLPYHAVPLLFLNRT